MRYRLYTSGLDEDDAASDFPSKEAAIAYAAWWFLDGYTGNKTMQDQPDERVYEYLRELLERLERGEEFYCSRFYERARIEAVEPTVTPQ